MRKRFSEEQIVGILREGQGGQETVEQLCRAHGIAQPTYYGWKRRHGSMAEPDVRRLREPGEENARLKRLLAERDVGLDVIKEFLEKKWRAWPGGGRSWRSRGRAGSRRAAPASW